ncbi:transporter [Biformimicrobium ophioploci]|uniref:Transporter n=1 Tax=Biformimicrobium ophioploci TaxID=3036711 RepID=A0ABQ6M250_9GAMM|nr:transporter [Microbulbifer sp. NKW57]GMG88342.1 hypothetical protein MNKW57_26630 [Microbulbifer sp. NKW57]
MKHQLDSRTLVTHVAAWTLTTLLTGPAFAQNPGEDTAGVREEVQSSGAVSAEEAAKKLANPIASLISVPFQFNYDENIGPNDSGDRWQLNIQPVIPISINEDWNLIIRSILPVIDQSGIFPGAGSQQALGDNLTSMFFSPKEPSESGWTWGAGPVFLLPTATDDLTGLDTFGMGPTGVALRQSGPWTYGSLVNHITTFGNSVDLNNTFLQPFVAYTTKSAWTFSMNSESTYSWTDEEWSVPINMQVTKVLTVGGQMIQVGGGARYWVDDTTGSPEGWGGRLIFTLLFPR